jgi:pimeloyl-ACP methyl ester carboxylesterase
MFIDETTVTRLLEVDREIMRLVKSDLDTKEITLQVARRFADLDGSGWFSAERLRARVERECAPRLRSQCRHDPRVALRELRLPVFAAYGGKDELLDATRNENSLREALGFAGNGDVSSRIYPNLDHGLADVESAPEFMIDPHVLEALVAWVKERTMKSE